ncbi:MAG TPA: uroporphyrinogen-III synthase [Edaphobacter sp.]
MSLDGKRILVTRTRRQSSALAEQLALAGATPIVIPAIEIGPPTSYEVLDKSLAVLDTFDWLLFTSANAVSVFAARRNASLLPKSIAAIGPATEKAIEALGLTVELLPPRYVAESFAEALIPHAAGKRILLVRAEEARDVLPEALTAAGAKLIIAPAYRNQVPEASIPAMRDLFSTPDRYPDIITLTSASTSRSLIALLEAAGLTLPRDIALASIGPVTTSAILELGYEPTVEATEATIPALVDAIRHHFTAR